MIEKHKATSPRAAAGMGGRGQRKASERRRVAEEAERLRAQAEQTASWNEAEAQRLREQASQLSAESERKLAAERSAVIGSVERRTASPTQTQKDGSGASAELGALEPRQASARRRGAAAA